MKGLLVSILEDRAIGDCTNGGISADVKHAILTGEGLPEILAPSHDCPELRLIRRGTYCHCEPTIPVRTGNVGYMFGGNFVYSSDSRFHKICDYPIPIHDRQDTQADYDVLSR